MNYAPIPSLALPETVIPERGLPGWILVIVVINPRYVIYSAIKSKEIVMAVRQDSINASIKVKDTAIDSRVVEISAETKEVNIAIAARVKSASLPIRIKEVLAEQ